jgi:putative FmdB family regulatory protein
MPIYEYKCPVCATLFDELRKVEDRDKPAKCPEKTCAHEAVKQVSVTSFELKGGGWAKDGYSG